MSHRFVHGTRRLSMLSPTLIRLEFAPDGAFDERRSMVAYQAQQPRPFTATTEEDGWQVLETGAMQIRCREGDRPFSRTNLEIRWSDGKLLQFWRPGDRDYQNLGGTLRSLDRYGNDGCRLDGVHVAGMESPDPVGTAWPAWLQCEVDPLYTELHPGAPEGFGRGNWLRKAKAEGNDGSLSHRTFNWYKECRRFCPGILSASGYFLLNDSVSAVLDDDDFPVERERPGYQDWYFFAYGSDYKQALADFHLLSGPPPLPTHRSLGIIFSRWPAFSEDEVRDMARDFAANGYPLSTLVMDMEWHKEGWGHWEFNPELIPDPEAFFALCRTHGLEVVFNDHPLDVRDDDCHFDAYVEAAGPDVQVRRRQYNDKALKMAQVDITNKQQTRAFLQLCSTPIQELGLDYWWNDGSRGQMATTCGQLVTSKSFFEVSERDGRRGWLFARYGGLGSHRYGAFFTGDANSDWEVLRLQVEFNVRAAGVGLTHISHDIGGFMIPQRDLVRNHAGTAITDPVRYLRWLQFGVMGPVLRFHCAPASGSRLPYDYDSEVGGACRHWLRLRHALLPYLYTAARTSHDTGLPITRPLFLEHPADARAYRWDQYYLGPDLLVAPIASPDAQHTTWLPPGTWYELDTAKPLPGDRDRQRQYGLRDYPVFVRAGAIIPRRDPDGDLHSPHIATLGLDIYPGADGSADLYEDDGRSTAYRDGAGCRSRFTLSDRDGVLTLRGAIVEGEPLGAERTVQLNLWLEAAPASVSVDGVELECRQEARGAFCCELPTRATADPFEVTVTRASST